MKPSTSKLVLAVATGATSAFGDLAVQLQSGQLVNANRLVVVGVGMGVIVRVIGAGLAYLVARAATESPVEGGQ